MKKRMIEKLIEFKKTFITLDEIEEIIDKATPYFEIVTLIKNIIDDGILKPVRKRYEWQNSITFFKI